MKNFVDEPLGKCKVDDEIADMFKSAVRENLNRNIYK